MFSHNGPSSVKASSDKKEVKLGHNRTDAVSQLSFHILWQLMSDINLTHSELRDILPDAQKSIF